MKYEIDRGPKAIVHLNFDGSATPNPGQGGAACTATVKIHYDSHTTTEKLQRALPLGETTSNAAEYIALIAGLRMIYAYLKTVLVRHSYVKLIVCGDSEVVIDQMTGRSKVSSPRLEPLHVVAKRLASSYLDIEFRKVSRSENVDADRLAKAAKKQELLNMKAVRCLYYPSLMNMIEVSVEGVNVSASHDLVTSGSDPTSYIDINFLRTLPGGDGLLANMRDPFPLSLMDGKVQMTILGFVALGVCVHWKQQSPDESLVLAPEKKMVVEFAVVDALPVPVHISFYNKGILRPTMEYNIRETLGFKADNLPSPYCDHPYWSSNEIFIDYEGWGSF